MISHHDRTQVQSHHGASCVCVKLCSRINKERNSHKTNINPKKRLDNLSMEATTQSRKR